MLVDREEGEVGEDEGEGPRQQQDHAVAVAGRGGQLEPPLDLLNGWKNKSKICDLLCEVLKLSS